jgi:S-adenosylmethionine synthetase
MKNLFTSESVTNGHPDKICDIISDSILDEALRQDSDAKMAVECTIKDDLVLIYGEANFIGKIDYKKIARDTIKQIGYEEEYDVIVKVSHQSPEINNAVCGETLGAGDQGIMFGYACNETTECMPLSIMFAHQLSLALKELREKCYNCGIMPDGKTQVTVKYDDNGKLSSIDTILISTQHKENMTKKEIEDLVMIYVINATIIINDYQKYIDKDTKYIINPSGSFTIGGSFGDSGTTGRKIVVDTYGGHGRIGGGCFSSKDPSKVDRSAAYYARYVAKNIVMNGFATKCEIQVSYGIGMDKPISLNINCFGTETIHLDTLYDLIHANFDFSPDNMIEELDLKKPIYKRTACFGHFGRNYFSWEKFKEISFSKLV